jgi:hypothetical protein
MYGIGSPIGNKPTPFVKAAAKGMPAIASAGSKVVDLLVHCATTRLQDANTVGALAFSAAA